MGVSSGLLGRQPGVSMDSLIPNLEASAERTELARDQLALGTLGCGTHHLPPRSGRGPWLTRVATRLGPLLRSPPPSSPNSWRPLGCMKMFCCHLVGKKIPTGVGGPCGSGTTPATGRSCKL